MNRILVVDDDTDILDVMKMLLERNNFSVNAISKWKDIPALITNFHPDLILLDISLSGADGRLICKELKSDKETEAIFVLLFSANHNMGKHFEQYYADGFIAKPFEVPHLVAKIHSILKKD